MAYSWCNPRDPSVDRMHRPRPRRQVRLEEVMEAEISDESDETTTNYSSTESLTTQNIIQQSSIASSVEKASVFLRLRPAAHNDQLSDFQVQGNTLSVSNVSNQRNVEKTYTFSGIFHEEDQQKTVYRNSVKKLIENDNDAVVLTYGTSGSGKTHTILGDEHNPGIIPRAIKHLFKRYNDNVKSIPIVKIRAGKLTFLTDEESLKEEVISRELLAASNSAGCGYLVPDMLDKIEQEEDFVTESFQATWIYVWISFMEIYNEKVYDLLDISADQDRRKELKVIFNDGSVYVKNLRSVFVRSPEEVIRIMKYGFKNVSYASTSINSNSSRSHCILNVDVITENCQNGFVFSTYKFGDLAGSERLKKTENVGKKLKEAQHINNSLLVLSRCLDILNSNTIKKKKDLVPYRESKLTMLIKSALQGLENFVMIVNMYRAVEFYEENMHVLSFASIAKELTLKPIGTCNRRQQKNRISFISSYANTTLVDLEVLTT